MEAVVVSSSLSERARGRIRKLLALAADQADRPEGQAAHAKAWALLAEAGLREEDLAEWWPTCEGATGMFEPRFDLLCVLAAHLGLVVRSPGEDGIPAVGGDPAQAARCRQVYWVLRRAIEANAMFEMALVAATTRQAAAWDDAWTSALLGVMDRSDLGDGPGETPGEAPGTTGPETMPGDPGDEGPGDPGDEPPGDPRGFLDPGPVQVISMVFSPRAYATGFRTPLPSAVLEAWVRKAIAG